MEADVKSSTATGGFSGPWPPEADVPQVGYQDPPGAARVGRVQALAVVRGEAGVLIRLLIWLKRGYVQFGRSSKVNTLPLTWQV
jgi:hypothetical protein